MNPAFAASASGSSGMARDVYGSSSAGMGRAANAGFASSARSANVGFASSGARSANVGFAGRASGGGFGRRHNVNHHHHHHGSDFGAVAVGAGLGAALIGGALVANELSHHHHHDHVVVAQAGYPAAAPIVMPAQPMGYPAQQPIVTSYPPQQPAAPPQLLRAPGQQPANLMQYQGQVAQSQSAAPPPPVASFRPWPPQWERDDLAPQCRVCAKSFTMFVRRHHCRCCNRVVCDDCSTRRVQGQMMPPIPPGPQRCCNVCYDVVMNDHAASGTPPSMSVVLPPRSFPDGVLVSAQGLTIPRTLLTMASPSNTGDSMLHVNWSEVVALDGGRLLQSVVMLQLFAPPPGLYPATSNNTSIEFATMFASAVHILACCQLRRFQEKQGPPTADLETSAPPSAPSDDSNDVNVSIVNNINVVNNNNGNQPPAYNDNNTNMTVSSGQTDMTLGPNYNYQ